LIEGRTEICLWQQIDIATPSISTSLLGVRPPLIDTLAAAAWSDAARWSEMPLPKALPGVTRLAAKRAPGLFRPVQRKIRDLSTFDDL
jgi:hypothetical protein